MVFIWKYAVRPAGGVFDIYELLPAFLIALGVNVLVSLLTGKPDKEVEEEFEPCISTMGFFPYLKYTLLCTLIFCSVVEIIDTFSFFDLKELGLKIITDTFITLVCIFCVEAVFRRDKSEERF